MTELAAALGVLRSLDSGQPVSDAVLLATHDLLYTKAPRHLGEHLMRKLAEALVSRGVVPEPHDYEGRWWLWWPKAGRGPCRDCGQMRSLTRYSARYGNEYRYLCNRCRSAEREQITQQAARLLHERINPMPAATTADSGFARGPLKDSELFSPSRREWDSYATRLDELLAGLEWAGFDLPEEWDTDFDPGQGAQLFAILWRGDGALDVQYSPHQGVLALQPFEDVTGDWPESYSLLEEAVEIPVGPGKEGVTAVEAAAGKEGLLDAAHVRVAETAPPEAKQEFTQRRIRRIFQPAAAFRGLPLTDVLREATENEQLSSYLQWVLGMAGRDVAPDVVPAAAALGVAAWRWRNNTAVEAHHLETDVLMARVNIAVTRIIQQHVCPVEGIDWAAIKDALTDPKWTLPNGTLIRSLFGEGWAEVASTVTAELDRWRRLDHEVLGPETTLILMSIGGSTSYTCSWWGQGRWHSMCSRVIDDALAAGLPLPAPYDQRGRDALMADLDEAPDRLPDAVLDWLIDLPDAGIDGPYGLRMSDVTRPPQCCWDSYRLTEGAL
ncbi:hypothetical protein ACFRCI_44445 [Streptomyces sp. NPDC056638]|uniref:hypothetical protein n=1 Tax=Streptomyces sp. NPDC056638 TaxID=3345887 RepID=UPI0036B48065